MKRRLRPDQICAPFVKAAKKKWPIVAENGNTWNRSALIRCALCGRGPRETKASSPFSPVDPLLLQVFAV